MKPSEQSVRDLPTDWLRDQLDHAAAEFEKWPQWMKDAARKDQEEIDRQRKARNE